MTKSFVFIFSFLLSWGSISYGAGSTGTANVQQSKKLIQEIIKGEDFHKEETISEMKITGDWFDKLKRKESVESQGSSTGSDFIFGIVAFIAQGFEIILWCVILFLVVIYLFKYRSWFLSYVNIQSNPSPEKIRTKTLFGLDVREESLPDDIPAAAQKLWKAGKQREAMSLLYRSCLAKLMILHSIEFQDGATEMECSQLVNKQLSADISTFFQQLTQTWLLLAYGHRNPEGTTFLNLCRQWSHYFADHETS